MDYGRLFLSENEYDKRFKIKEKAYYDKIANDLLHSRKKLQYHKQNLNAIQLSFKWTRLFRSLLKELFFSTLYKLNLQFKRT
jgi:hypothetical protein